MAGVGIVARRRPSTETEEAEMGGRNPRGESC